MVPPETLEERIQREAAEYPAKTEKRFWNYVEKTDSCWIWTGLLSPLGYSRFSLKPPGGKKIDGYAYRYSWELANKQDIPKGMEVDHICRNPACVNPEHLRLTTRKQNRENTDKAQKNNKSSGVRGVQWNKKCKLWQVRVCHNYKDHYGGTYKTLAEAESAAIALRNRLFTHNDWDRK